MKNKHNTVTPSSGAGYIPGGNWVVCDICGFRMRAFEARTQPHGPNMGLLVCAKDYDRKNPQWDELEAVEERIVPNIVNQEGEIEYVNSDDSLSDRVTVNDL